MLLHDLVADAARAAPDAPALMTDGVVTSFGRLDQRITRLAAAVAAGSRPGDRIGFVGDNCGAWVEAYYGVPRAGRVLTPLNQRLAAPELATLVAAAGVEVAIGHRRYLDHLPESVATIGLDDGGYDRLLDEGPATGAGEPAEPTPAPDDLAWLLFTSGTTGRPKGAMLTHASISAAVRNTLAGRPVAGDDVYLFPFPLCHVAGYNVLVFHAAGRPVVLLPRFDAAAVADATEEHAVTAMSLAPTMLLALLDHLDATGRSLPTLRSIGYGASPMTSDLLRRAADRLGPHVRFSEGYGMTELSGNAVFEGKPAPLIEVRLIDDEIVVRGEQVTRGYWNDEQATAAAFTDGWFHTGDLGRFDDDGRLRVVDRKKDIVVTGGENVASREVEDALAEHPAVAAAAVVGVPDEYWGEAVCAVVVLATGRTATAGELIAHVRARLAGFKRPRHVVFVDALPVNAGGKVLKDEVRAMARRAIP